MLEKLLVAIGLTFSLSLFLGASKPYGSSIYTGSNSQEAPVLTISQLPQSK